MTKKQAFHILLLGLVGIIGGVADSLSQSHYVWAPIAVAILADVKLAFPTAFKPPVAVLAVVALLSLGGCKSVLGPTPPPNTPGFVNCSDAALHAAALDILPSVETALASPTYEAALATIIAGVGGPLALAEVECAVAWVASKAEKAETDTGDPLEGMKTERARAWLAAHPVTFQ